MRMDSAGKIVCSIDEVGCGGWQSTASTLVDCGEREFSLWCELALTSFVLVALHLPSRSPFEKDELLLFTDDPSLSCPPGTIASVPGEALPFSFDDADDGIFALGRSGECLLTLCRRSERGRGPSGRSSEAEGTAGFNEE